MIKIKVSFIIIFIQLSIIMISVIYYQIELSDKVILVMILKINEFFFFKYR